LFGFLLSDEKTEIIKRYPNGQKWIMVTYEDLKANEKIINRYTFNIQGDVIGFEDFLNPDSYYIKNPNLLNGYWILESMTNGGKNVAFENTFFSLIKSIENDFIVYLGNEQKIGDIDSLIVDYGNYGKLNILLHRESKEKPEGSSFVPISQNEMLWKYVDYKNNSVIEVIYEKIYIIPSNISLLIKNYENH